MAQSCYVVAPNRSPGHAIEQTTKNRKILYVGYKTCTDCQSCGNGPALGAVDRPALLSFPTSPNTFSRDKHPLIKRRGGCYILNRIPE